MSSPDSPAQMERAAGDAAAARLVRRTVKQWPLILACAVIAAVAGFVASNSRLPEYEATTTIQLNVVDLSSLVAGSNVQQQGDDAQSKAATNAKLVTLPRVRQATSRMLGGRISPNALKERITVTPDAGTTLVGITAKDRSPQFAADIANTTRQAFLLIRKQITSANFNEAEQDLQQQLQTIPKSQRGSAASQLIRDRIQQVATLRSVANGGVILAQSADVPSTPSSPNPRRDAILALFAGALIGLAVALLRARLDQRVRDTQELTELWDLPVLGLIPESKDLRDGQAAKPSATALESFALARTNLRYLNVGGDVKTVVITSALQEEGKSTCSWSLALAAALAGSKVLLIEADMRKPVLGPRVGLVAQSGLSEVLAGLASFESSVIQARITPDDALVADVDVLLAGMVPPSPIALLERPACKQLLDQVSAFYDLILIDTPPATLVADAKVLAQHADGVLIVSRLDRVRRPAFERLRDLLSADRASVVGVIVNGGATKSEYGYGGYVAQGTTD